VDLGGANGDIGGTSPTDADLPTTSSCKSSALGPGTHKRTLTHDGLKRKYDLHVPKGYVAGTPTPVVFYFHPLMTTKHYLKAVGGLELADREGFIAVFPQGEGSSWNAGACCGPANGASGKKPVDDVGFVRAMIAEISQLLCVDGKRIYATGFSNGGFLSHRLACEASDVIAAIAPVSAVNGIDASKCTPGRAVPVMMINGTNDSLVPYKGGFSFGWITNGAFISVKQTFGDWAKRNECAGTPAAKKTGTVECRTHTACKQGAQVRLCTAVGGGHCWFGEMICFLGTNTADIVATDATWAFLKQFSLP
jgi:polyhydroxybutyrate depolymerase